ncbi:homocysteine S-methyltransferase family protein [Desulfovibrio cuneatus]|uniref:homocysteine S-methyltransferase family protein n=1 Tax=Desulfovibrio cuneatus TaxID=159728 RepID=UPI000415E13B|nr:homocysteine S-methyltransferase family protein [Desulfovibrio cuneatus]
MNSFASLLAARKRLLFDGAMGTELQGRGLVAGQSPELFSLEHPEILEGVHADYVAAGADLLTTNTFGASRYKLPKELEPYAFNKRMAQTAKAAASRAGRPVFVAGNVGPTGVFLAPMGDVSFEAMVEAFAEQMRGLADGGADLLFIQTQYDIAEVRAAVVAARQVCRLPIVVSMTYEDGATLTGSGVPVCIATLANMGVDVVGMNCSAGPVEMAPHVAAMLAESPLPVLVQPNAGLPQLENGRTVFPLGPEEFATLTAQFAKAGAQVVGGCCGTTPAHIRALRNAVEGLPALEPRPVFPGVALTTRSSLVRIGAGFPHQLIGERINPTGKKALTAALQAGELQLAMQFAEEQIAAGAKVLDVNVGAPMVDEVRLLPELVSRLASAVPTPLVIDSSNPEAVEAALRVYPASPLVNSISGEAGRMARLGPLCRDYGAPFILLPLQGGSLPVTAAERIAVIEALLAEMDALGVPRRLAVVDILALTISSSEQAAAECVQVIRHCENVLGLPTVCGLSNISFGLPARDLVNAAFLTLATGAGLSACIANPGAPRVAEALDTLRLLQGNDEGAESFIARYSGWKHSGGEGSGAASGGNAPRTGGAGSPAGAAQTLDEAVIKGDKAKTLELTQAALDAGNDPFSLVNDVLIPAITQVGDKYERKEYFLPQLIRSAEAMQAAFGILRPLLAKDSRTTEKPVIILATVEGDIHDIGKNIVSLLMSNHGFEVVDLGKDVSAGRIVEAACTHNAKLIGLSALMTTTMVRMQDTIALLRERNLEKKVLVGGAVVTEAFARSIGAHYSSDAVDAVRLAKELFAAQ